MNCPICKQTIVPAAGPLDSGILIVGEFPGEEEMNRGIPFVGVSGQILRNEFAQAGISLDTCRLTNLWLHPSMDYENEKHFQWHLGELLREVTRAKHVLFMGSELGKVFLRRPISSIVGLELPVPLLGGKKVTFCINAAAAMHGSLGEIRLAIQKFAERCGYVL
jgi:uracil-DNA glycosylase family 4